ncbi:MAG: hypothetical protein HQ557_08240 [Bacteroidetes bacterium]|nr:hypothetical protein [Bacteroidota bacterium]
MKKLYFIILTILIILVSQVYLYAENKSSSLVLTGIVQPRIVISISEQTDSRNINSETETENLQVFVMNDSENVKGRYRVVIESQNAIEHQNKSPFFTDPNSDGLYWDYAVFYNDQILEFASGQAMVKPIGYYKNSISESTIKIANFEKESLRPTGQYSDTLIMKVIAN